MFIYAQIQSTNLKSYGRNTTDLNDCKYEDSSKGGESEIWEIFIREMNNVL